MDVSKTPIGGTFSPAPQACRHCGAPAPEGAAFCCAGCATVYDLLQERESLRAGRSEASYAYLDSPEFLETYATKSTDGLLMHFHLEGAHCAACVSSTEGVADVVPGVRAIRLDLANSVAAVHVGEGGKFAPVAWKLALQGYEPVPVRSDEVDGASRGADRKLLIQLGVAGACAGNIMLLTTSLYAGAGGAHAQVFRWVSFLLALPVLLYSALPFYRGAWSSIASRQVSIDLPIALGIALGGISSIVNLVTGSEYLYFDSLTMLVFLMLSSRYLLKRSQQSALSSSRLARFLTPSHARVWNELEGRFLEAPVERIREGDIVRVLPQESLPVDGVVCEGATVLNLALLTGESQPVRAVSGDPVFAGTVNEGDAISVRSTAEGVATRLGRILKSVEEDLAKKARIATFSDRIARYFVAAVLLAVAVVFAVGLRSGLHQAIDLALALSIVTCPCAFALGTPLALSLALGRCARAGVLVKSADALERLAGVDKVFVDKTGTLTEGVLGAARFVGGRALSREEKAAVVAIESRSSHGVARAIVRLLAPEVKGPLPEVRFFRETPGFGVRAVVGNRQYELSRGEGDGLVSSVVLSRDGSELGAFHLQDRVRPSSRPALQALSAMGLSPEILSGDSEPVVRSLSAALGLGDSFRAGLSPEQKREIVARSASCLMAGDGANDAPALAAAPASVAVQGGMEVSLRSASAYSRRPGIGAIAPLITVGRETIRVIHRNFGLSLVYNALGIALVLDGRLTPLFAAILMPISAFTVFLSSIAGTRRMRLALKEMRG